MAKPGTTHVVEIETGIGEPAFIPLTVGQELQPISVGKKGMWRIESARVLDVHAFIYFDGSSLFVQSADESQPAAVDGYRVGKAWTELHAPCHIEIGAARLRFRNLSEPIQEAPQKQQQQQEQRPPSSQPRSQPIANESGPTTRVNPIDGRPASHAPAPPSHDGGSRSVRPTGPIQPGMQPVQAIPQGQYPANMQQPPQMQQMNETIPQGMFPAGSLPPQSAGPSGSNGVASNSGPYSMTASMNTNPMGGGTMAMQNPNMGMASGPYGSGAYSRGAPTVQTHQPADGGGYLAKYKELNPTKRLLVLLAPFCLIASAYLLLFDDDVPAPPLNGAQVVDAGARVATPVPTNPMQPQCPQGFVPYPFPVGGQIPCVPAGSVPGPAPGPTGSAAVQPTAPTGRGPQPPPTLPPKGNPDVPIPPPPVFAQNKTLERQAVDAVAINDYNRAAQLYEALLQQNPNNRVYAEAARILRQKADAGAPLQ